MLGQSMIMLRQRERFDHESLRSVNGFDPQCEYMPIIEIYPPPYEGQELSCRTSERLFYLYLPKDYSEIEAAFPAMFSLQATQAQPKPI